VTEGPFSARVQREQEAFNEGLQRDGYMRVFEHTSYLFGGLQGLPCVVVFFYEVIE